MREIALDLAQRHGADRGKVWLAASAHDLAREWSGPELLARAGELGIESGLPEEVASVFLHGPVAAELLKRQGLDDPEVYNTVFWHSTARAGMTLVEKVVYLADKLDPEKAHRYPYLPEIRKLANDGLDEAILEFRGRDIARLLCSGGFVHPATLGARNQLLLKRRPRHQNA